MKSLALVLALSVAVGAATAQQTVVSVAQDNPDLIELYERLSLFTDLVEALNDTAFVGTVFAPTNEAFERAHLKLTAAAAFTGLELTPALLKDVLSYHVVPDVAATAADLTDGQQLPTLNAAAPPLEVEKTETMVKIQAVGSAATVTQADIPVNSAVVHTVDEVLLPLEVPTFEFNSTADALVAANLTSLLAAIEAAGLEDLLADFPGTIFAPTNAAFEASMAAAAAAGLELTPDLLAEILAYHLINTRLQSTVLLLSDKFSVNTVQGERVEAFVADDGKMYVVDARGVRAEILVPDVTFGNGVTIHIIDNVLLPSLAPAPGAAEVDADAEAPTPTPAAPASSASAAAAGFAALAGSLLAAALLM